MGQLSSVPLLLPSRTRGWVRADAIDPLQPWISLLIVSTFVLAIVGWWTTIIAALLCSAAVIARSILWLRNVAAGLGRFEAWIERAKVDAGEQIRVTVLLPAPLGGSTVTATLEERDREGDTGSPAKRFAAIEVKEWQEIPEEVGQRRGATLSFDLPQSVNSFWNGQRYSRHWAIEIDLTTVDGRRWRIEAPLTVRQFR